MQVLTKMCCDGLLTTFRRRLAQRPTSEGWKWTLHRYLTTPRVVSHKAAQVPGLSGAGLRQAVVQIRSQQSLERLTPEGKVIAGTGGVREKTEYLVIQKKMWNEKEEPWMVWGTIEESNWKEAILQ